jgi:hypothetical protein
VTYALVAGHGLEDLKANADEAVETYQRAVVANEAATTIPAEFSLDQNYPNPFNPDGAGTTIEYSVAEPGPVTITVFDLTGKEVGRLVDEVVGVGRHSVNWRAGAAPSGIYVVRMQAGSYSSARMVSLVK